MSCKYKKGEKWRGKAGRIEEEVCVCVCEREREHVTERVQIRATEKAVNEKVKGRKRE